MRVPAWFDRPEVREASARREYGKVLKAARLARGMTLRQAGDALGCSYATVSRYETGAQRFTDVDILVLASRALNVPPELFGLAGDGTHAGMVAAPETQEVQSMNRRIVLAGLAVSAAAVPKLRAANAPIIHELDTALIAFDTGLAPLPLPRLRRMIQTAQQYFANCQMRELAAVLPKLIGVTQASRTAADPATSAAFDAVLADANALASRLAIKLHEHAVAWVLADRALHAARASDDPRALARARWQVAIAMRRSKHPGSATAVVSEAAGQLRAATGLATPWDAGFCARLWCCAAYTEALNGHGARAYDLLEHAREVTREFPYASFGTDAIDEYGISVARAVGDFGRAVEYARRIRIGALPDVERQARYWEDTAIALWGKRQAAQTFQALLAAERLAPQEVQMRPWAHRLTVNLLSLGPQTVSLGGLREFAGRIGVGTGAIA